MKARSPWAPRVHVGRRASRVGGSREGNAEVWGRILRDMLAITSASFRTQDFLHGLKSAYKTNLEAHSSKSESSERGRGRLYHTNLIAFFRTWLMMALFTAFQPSDAVPFFIIGATIILIARAFRPRKTKYCYPPGPRGIPVFGNLFQLPPVYPGAKLMEWGKQYGDL